MYNLPCTYGATMLLERDSFLAETQDIILTVLLHLRTDKKKNSAFIHVLKQMKPPVMSLESCSVFSYIRDKN